MGEEDPVSAGPAPEFAPSRLGPGSVGHGLATLLLLGAILGAGYLVADYTSRNGVEGVCLPQVVSDLVGEAQDCLPALGDLQAGLRGIDLSFDASKLPPMFSDFTMPEVQLPDLAMPDIRELVDFTPPKPVETPHTVRALPDALPTDAMVE